MIAGGGKDLTHVEFLPCTAQPAPASDEVVAKVAQALQDRPGLCAEGLMHDTATLLGALGWSAYDAPTEIVTPNFGASGTGQINVVFPVTPQDGRAIPKAVASSAESYTNVATRLQMPHLVT